MSLFGVRRWPVTLRHGPITLRPLRLRDEDEWHSVRARNHAWTQPWDSTRPPEAEGPGITFAQMVATNRAEGRAGRALPWGIFWAEPGEPPPPPAKARAEAPSVETPVATLAVVERKALCSERVTLLMLLMERTPLLWLVNP